MIDNFNLIEPFINFNEINNLFFHLQIIQRGKDINIGSNNRTIKHYYIQSVNNFLNVKDEIIQLCEIFKARAYINLNVKDFQRFTEMCNLKFAQRLCDHNFIKPYKITSTVAGELKSDFPRWIVDIDTKDESVINKISNEIKDIYDNMDKGEVYYNNCIITTIPTKNGIHLITHPFRLDKFKELEPEIDVHKNNPTVLYIPKSLD